MNMAKSKKKRKDEDRIDRTLWFVSVLILAFQLGYSVGKGPETEPESK